MNSPWHASAAVLDRFARDPAGLDAATAASVETHLVACADCRSAVARAADPSFAAGTWAAIGSSGTGRTITRSPSSAIATREVRQRLRTPAGSESCPLAVTLAITTRSMQS